MTQQPMFKNPFFENSQYHSPQKVDEGNKANHNVFTFETKNIKKREEILPKKIKKDEKNQDNIFSENSLISLNDTNENQNNSENNKKNEAINLDNFLQNIEKIEPFSDGLSNPSNQNENKIDMRENDIRQTEKSDNLITKGNFCEEKQIKSSQTLKKLEKKQQNNEGTNMQFQHNLETKRKIQNPIQFEITVSQIDNAETPKKAQKMKKFNNSEQLLMTPISQKPLEIFDINEKFNAKMNGFAERIKKPKLFSFSQANKNKLQPIIDELLSLITKIKQSNNISDEYQMQQIKLKLQQIREKLNFNDENAKKLSEICTEIISSFDELETNKDNEISVKIASKMKDLNLIERETAKKRAELEIWKYQAEKIEKKSKNSNENLNLNDEKAFQDAAISLKLSLPENHQGWNVLIADLYKKCKELKIPAKEWSKFLANELSSTKP